MRLHLDKSRRPASILFLFAATLFLCFQSQSEAQDNFDGAVWNFKLTSKKNKKLSLIGRFRVNKNVIYQKKDKSDEKFTRRVGKNNPSGKKTKLELQDLKVLAGKKKKIVEIKGTARLTLDKIGKWQGMFTDGKGGNWEMTATRVQE